MNVNFTPEALSDLQNIRHYIAKHNEPAADRVISRIRQVVDIFGTFPLLGRPGIVEDTREFPIPGLPYIIVYQIASEADLNVLAVIHERQKYPVPRRLQS